MVLSLMPWSSHAFLAPAVAPASVSCEESGLALLEDAFEVLKHSKVAQTSSKSRETSVAGQSGEGQLKGADSGRAGSSIQKTVHQPPLNPYSIAERGP